MNRYPLYNIEGKPSTNMDKDNNTSAVNFDESIDNYNGLKEKMDNNNNNNNNSSNSNNKNNKNTNNEESDTANDSLISSNILKTDITSAAIPKEELDDDCDLKFDASNTGVKIVIDTFNIEDKNNNDNFGKIKDDNKNGNNITMKGNNNSISEIIATSVSSTESEFSIISCEPPTSLNNTNDSLKHSQSLSISNQQNNVFDSTNDILSISDDEDDEVDADDEDQDIDESSALRDSNKSIKLQRRRSSKRAMSSSLDEYTKFKTRICIEELKLNNNNDLSRIKTEHDTDTDTITTLKRNSLDTPFFNLNNQNNNLNVNAFDKQLSYFSSHKSIPFLPHCKLLSNDEVIIFILQSLNKKLPDVDIMFPWLHGIHSNNYGQISFLSNNQSFLNKPKIISFEKPTPLDDDNFSTATSDSESTSSDDDIDRITQITQTPDARFLMPVRSCNSEGEIYSNYTSIVTESTGFIKGTVTAEDILISYSNILNLELYLQSILPSEIFKIYHLETIITDCIITQLVPVFKNLDPEVGINLRNFDIQVSKISNISDFIVYCFNNEDHNININQEDDIFINNKCKCINLSRLLHIAQIVYQNQHSEIIKKKQMDEYLNNKKYNTFVLDDPNINKFNRNNLIAIPIIDESITMKKDDELCSIYDINVFNNWDSNYLYRERLEISKMSTASPISKCIWIGNITDYECLQIQLNNNKKWDLIKNEEINQLIKNQNKDPLYCNSTNTIVKLTKNDFFNKDSTECDKLLISFPLTIWKFYIKCVEGSRIPTLDQLKLIYDNYKDCNYINIEFPPSGSISLADMSDDDILSIINICKFCYYICNYEFPALIYCSDGYTESSLLTLCYLMYSENIGIDEAILKLHLNYGRPFFIFKTDYTLLSKLEAVMNKYSPNSNDEENRENFKFETNSKFIRSLLLKPKRRNSVGKTVGGTVGNLSNTSFITNTGHHVVQLRGIPTNNNLTYNNQQQPRFSKNKFGVTNSNIFQMNNNIKNLCKPIIEGCLEDVCGSLPSRILKHMYLGSLIHATSISLLNRLKIEYIVSVGERITWSENFEHEKEILKSGCEIITFKKGQIDKESGYEFNIKKMIILPNINDDGIGTLIETIDNTLEFIEEVYKDDNKCLVHCQVGVSRSASICIAEVMKRLKFSIARAYMFVRVRRLNVIIQPNLKLMYELFKWEEKNLKKIKYDYNVLIDYEDDKKINSNNANTSIATTAATTNTNTTTNNNLISKRNDSISSESTIFTNNNKSERSSLSITRGNSLSSIGYNYMYNYGICENDEFKIGSIFEDEELEEEVGVSGIRGIRGVRGIGEEFYDVISNCNNIIREVDWYVLCREIFNLNRTYIKNG